MANIFDLPVENSKKYSQKSPPSLMNAFSSLMSDWGQGIQGGLMQAAPFLGANNPEEITQAILDSGIGMAGLASIKHAGSAAKLAKMKSDKIAALRAESRANNGIIDDVIEDSYKMEHTAPMKDSGAPLHDLTQNGIYPDDVYSANGHRYYGANDAMDNKSFSIANEYRGSPDELVTMYRSVPDNIGTINNGDWVTLSKEYAEEHGIRNIGDNFRMLSEDVPARKLFTNGDSIQEFGYDQSGKINRHLMNYIAGSGLLGTGLVGSGVVDKKTIDNLILKYD